MKSIREIFLPNKDEYFVKLDLSQAEDRFAKMYCNSQRMRELANTPPWEFDVHTENARLIFGKEEISKDERYLGKKVVHACVDKETEILTETGFKPFPLLSNKDTIAQWDSKTGNIFFKKPNEIYKYNFDGLLLHFKSNCVDFLVTDNHNIGYYTRVGNNFSIKNALDISKLYPVVIPCAGIYEEGTKSLSKNIARILVAAQADSRFRDNFYCWRFKKKRKIERLKKLLNNENIPFSLSLHARGVTKISISVEESKKIKKYLKGGKLFDLKTLLTFKQETLKMILNEIPLWDGHQKPDRPKSFSYYSKYLANTDAVAILATLTGNKAICKCDTALRGNGRSTSVVRRDRATAPFQNFVPYKGMVYCVNTDTGFFVIRRDGKISITSNSWRGMGGNTMSEAVIRDTKGKIYLTPQKCNSLIKRFLDTNPEIKGFYFPWVEKNVREGGVLFNSWGRRYDVRGLRVDMSLLQACYSFYPQAENADWTNQYGVIPAHHFLTNRFKRPLSLQVHDEIVASLPFEGLYEFCVFAKNAMEQTRVIQGHKLKIPVEIKISDTLYGGIEFQQLPTKDKFEKQLKDYFKV